MSQEFGEDPGHTVRFQADSLRKYRLDQKVPTLLVLLGPDTGVRIPLQKPETTIGRTAEADIQLHDEQISRRHCVVRSDLLHQRYTVQDLHSTNGTRVNLKEVSEVELQVGDKIFVGSSVLKFELQDELELEHNDMLNRWVFNDDLTGLVVWRQFKNHLHFHLQRAQEQSAKLALLFMDMDGLKRVNDTWGHAMGASIITAVGRAIGSVVAAHGQACRFGGDEFVAYLREHDLHQGVEIAEAIRAAVKALAFDKDGHPIRVSISIGVAVFPDQAQGLDELSRCADEALYRAKSKGRDCVSD